MDIRLDYPTRKYSADDPEDLPSRLAEYLRKAGHRVHITADAHPNQAPGYLDIDTVLLAAGSHDAEILKLVAESGEFFDLYVQLGRGHLGIRGASVLIRLGTRRP